ncbi:hypothetical protein NliqN6_2129 [Naganishia liquefaciens]|uniref:Oxidoreductase-like domain-containing protein n=1 Tax=Naganishia liquefaciens TaxID=104408 RepID=A0A8H3TR69_9TREE|nr:hypothetical protein NliqN6_2129 [Naganishia liquefaciens]
MFKMPGLNCKPQKTEQSEPTSETRATTMSRCEISYEFDPKDHSPTYASLLKARIAIGRRQELERAARSDEPPNDEELTECCGSRCKPCVKELFYEKVDVWSECEAIRDHIAASRQASCTPPAAEAW